MDGDEINGGPLQLDYQTSSQPPHSMASPSHNHPTSPNRDQSYNHVTKNRHRFKSGNSQNSSNGSFSYQNGSYQNNITSNSNMAAYENNISASIQSVTL